MPKLRGSFIPDYDSLRSYTRGGCHLAGRSAGSCQDNEFQYDSKSCGLLTNQAKCRSLYDVKCKFNELDGTVKGWTNPLPGNTTKPAEEPLKGDSSPPVTCEFERTPFFTNIDQINEWNKKFKTPDTDKFYYDEAIKEFCSGTVSNCQARDADVCSRWTATGPEGSFCEIWAQANKDKADNAFKNYCGNSVNFNNADCACINAIKIDPNFKFLREIKEIGADYCWYTPCASPGVLNTFEDKSRKCPSTVCSISNQFINDKQIEEFSSFLSNFFKD